MNAPVLVFTFISGLTAAFALLHALLFVFFRQARANLYFALFAGLMSLFYLGVALAQLAGETGNASAWNLYLTTCGIPMMFAGIRFELAAFNQKIPLHVKVLAAFGAAVLASAWILREDFPGIWLNVLGILASVEMARIVVVAIARRHPDAWVIGAGFGFMTVVGIYEILTNVGLLSWWTPFALPAGVLALAFSMSAYLSRDVARTHHALGRQLAEVKRLDALTLAQQQQAHEAELERRLLEEQNRRQSSQLEKARQLQLSMLPAQSPESDVAEFAFKMWTAEEVGGDYYDYRQGPAGALTLALGDATGHGLDSGLMVAAAKSLFQGGDDEAGLAPTLERLSRGIRSMKLRRMNVAMQLVRIERRSLRVAAAGMPPVLLFRAATGEVEEITIPGTPLGALAAFPYQELELTWDAGDTLLMMSDGLPETVNAAGKDFGYERVRRLFRELARSSLDDILKQLYSAAQAFADGEPQADDLTLVVMRAKEGGLTGETRP